MNIKAIIFDLDDTLFDCTGMLAENARKRAARAMVSAGLPCSFDEAYKKIRKISERLGPRESVFDRLCEEFDIKGRKMEGIVKAGLDAYNSDTVEEISLFEDVPETLDMLKEKYKLILVSSGIYSRQQKKIDMLGLRKWFDMIVIHDIEKDPPRKLIFRDILKKLGLKPEEVVSVGDRIHSEIKICNELGISTVRILHGRFRHMKPKNELEEPDYEIKKIGEIPKILKTMKTKTNGLKIVAIGGGTGLPAVLEGLKKHTNNITAIVTVTDSGRSSGKIRNEFKILPPGDIRNCLIALSDSEKLLKELFQYRFKTNNDFNGMNFGNLFITALAKTTGGFEEAIREVSKILKIKGRVLPSTLADTHLCAELEDGTVVEQEFNVRKPGKPPIKKVFLKPEKTEPLEEALDAIKEADMIVLGPGSLFTSIITNLLVKGLSEAVARSRAKKIYIANIMTQPGQTDGFSLSDHVNTLESYLGQGVLDFVLVNSQMPPENLLEKYRKAGAEIVRIDEEKIKNKKIKLIKENLIENVGERRQLWEKEDLLRHDPDRLAHALLKIV